MFVGLLYVKLRIPESKSLKDKRQVVKSLLDTINRKFNVSAAEIDDLDLHQRAGLGFACVGNDKKIINGVLSKVLDTIELNIMCEVLDTNLEFI